MKRRSARPFMVEVKNTRAGRASLTSPNVRTRPDANLWQELAEAEARPPQPDIQLPAPPRPARKEPEAPARRVLPSLVPMFEPPAEPEPEAVAPPVRRPRTRSARAPAVAQAAAAPPAPKPAAKPRPAAARPEPPAAFAVEPTVRAPKAEPAEGPSPRPAPWRRTKELRLGERWKRRLPPFAR